MNLQGGKYTITDFTNNGDLTIGSLDPYEKPVTFDDKLKYFPNTGSVTGNYGDGLTVYSENATFDNPHAFPSGLKWVLVNGQVTWNGNSISGQGAGAVIRHRS